ncbi:MAG: UxaA family hydrolase [Thermotoga caldifontis]|uniref:UxaA family hydrolase n=1 Tax=Thermotoga caldifontis TaxID=1508419 RepID=UPI003C7AAAA9
MVDFLVHRNGDHVGVAVRDIKKGEHVFGKTVDGQFSYELDAVQDIPLGHKIALRDIQKGEKVIEYGEIIGAATDNIAKGAHVHVHNIRSLRWG